MQENISVSGVLCSSYDSFFEAEKKIADYILAHKSEIIDMTVAELALASGTSDATVSRFCRKSIWQRKWLRKGGIPLKSPMTSAGIILASPFRIFWPIRWRN